jgi:hypothetical protein
VGDEAWYEFCERKSCALGLRNDIQVAEVFKSTCRADTLHMYYT